MTKLNYYVEIESPLTICTTGPARSHQELSRYYFERGDAAQAFAEQARTWSNCNVVTVVCPSKPKIVA